MTTDMWSRLSAREAGESVFVEGVPEALELPLRRWINGQVFDRPWAVNRIMVRLSMAWKPDPQAYCSEDYDEEVDAQGYLAFDTESTELLDIVDALLDLLPPDLVPSARAVEEWAASDTADARRARVRLDQLLADARSIYEVMPDGSGLRRRIPEYTAAAIGQAASAASAKTDAGSAAAQLRAASNAAWALRPDASRAYSLAVKAVESVAHAVIEPNNYRATLGTMLGVLRSRPDDFELAISGRSGAGNIAPVVAVMSLLWDGQTSRHGAQTPTPEQTQEEGEMAVEMAAMLVAWFAVGKIRRRR
jgi:hypothetical protein